VLADGRARHSTREGLIKSAVAIPGLNASYQPWMLFFPFSGDLWALKIPSGELDPDEFGRIIKAFSMDDRCADLKDLLVPFYAKVDDCPDVAKSLRVQDRVAIKKLWEERMKRVDE